MTTPHGYSRYARSCGLLLLPAIAWNIAFTSTLMPASAMAEFWRDIPAPLVFTENALRAVVFALPFAMPLHSVTQRERRALTVFALGTFVYFASWVALMSWPQSAWSGSVLGSLAPAWTPILWLPALAVLGQRLFWGTPNGACCRRAHSEARSARRLLKRPLQKRAFDTSGPRWYRLHQTGGYR